MLHTPHYNLGALCSLKSIVWKIYPQVRVGREFEIKETKRTAPILLVFDKKLEEMKKDIFACIFELLSAEHLIESNCKLTA